MGYLLAGAVAGLGEGMQAGAKRQQEMAIEKERTDRSISVQRMRDKAAMERTGEQETGLAERLDARYGEGGFEETLRKQQQLDELERIKQRGQYQVDASAAGRGSIVHGEIDREWTDEFGMTHTKSVVYWQDKESKMWLEQHPTESIPIGLNVRPNLVKPEDVILYDNPRDYEIYKQRYGDLPPWFKQWFGKHVGLKVEDPEIPAPPPTTPPSPTQGTPAQPGGTGAPAIQGPPGAAGGGGGRGGMAVEKPVGQPLTQ